MITDHDNYYLKQKEPNKSCLLVLKDIILDLDENITPEWKYSLPFFYYKKKMFCYLWKDKKTQEPYIGICRGYEIDHPLLEVGNRKKMKIYRINPNEDIDVKNLKEIMNLALTRYQK
jgi:hypothetical protein